MATNNTHNATRITHHHQTLSINSSRSFNKIQVRSNTRAHHTNELSCFRSLQYCASHLTPHKSLQSPLEMLHVTQRHSQPRRASVVVARNLSSDLLVRRLHLPTQRLTGTHLNNSTKYTFLSYLPAAVNRAFLPSTELPLPYASQLALLPSLRSGELELPPSLRPTSVNTF